MRLILLSGGSGKRLWPLSNDSRSKQFLKILDYNGDLESMVQRVWRQLENLQLSKSTVIATSKSQEDIIYSQLGEHVPLIIEPERRDTFPAIALAAVYLYSVMGASLKETVGVLPVDPYVNDTFFERVQDLENILNLSGADLALIGVSPTYPSEKYGYIIPVQEEGMNSQNQYIEVSHFKEKPTKLEAINLIKQDALWNCGVFAFKLEYIITMLQTLGMPIQYEQLLKQYHKIEKISFDYAVVEKAEKIIAVPYDGYWKDLGTWNTLTEEMGTHQIGKGIISSDSTNIHLVNELDIPVTVMGIHDAVIAASPDGILVSDKMASQLIKEVLKGFEQRPMYEERRWGWYKVLDYTKFDEGNEVLTKRVGIKAGCNLSYQMHFNRSEVWTIIKGEGEVVLNNEFRPAKPGDVFVIPVEMKHAVKANSDMEIIEVQSGSQLIEEDIKRIYMTWDEIEKQCGLVSKN